MGIATNGHIPLASFCLLERTEPSLPKIDDLGSSIPETLRGLGISAEKLRGKRVAVAVGSRGIASLKEIVQAVCGWLKAQGAQPFIFPAMGSHGGGTAEGQRKILEDYGVTEAATGVEIRSSMETVLLGTTPEGFRVFVDRNAWESDGVVVINRIKPHTDFSGKIESGLLKMMAIGMGKLEGATEGHRQSWKYGFETALRAVSGKVLASGKILCGVALVENELHQIAVSPRRASGRHRGTGGIDTPTGPHPGAAHSVPSIPPADGGRNGQEHQRNRNGYESNWARGGTAARRSAQNFHDLRS